MKLRKMFAIFTLCVLFGAAGMTASAAEGPETRVDDSMVYDCDEYARIKDVVLQADILYANDVLSNEPSVHNEVGGTEEQLLNGYKIFSLAEPDFIAALQKGKGLSDIISDRYVWIVSTASNDRIKVVEDEGVWRVVGYSSSDSGEASTNIVRMEEVYGAITELNQESDEANVTVQCFEAPMYHTDFVYINIDDFDYLMPFGNRPDLTGLENGAIYTPQEVCGILGESFGVHGDDNAGFGNAMDRRFGLYAKYVVMAIAIISISIFGFVFVLARRKMNH